MGVYRRVLTPAPKVGPGSDIKTHLKSGFCAILKHYDRVHQPFAIGGVVTKGMVTPGMVTKGMVTKGAATRGMVTKGMATEGMVTKGMATKGAATKGMVTKSPPALCD